MPSAPGRRRSPAGKAGAGAIERGPARLLTSSPDADEVRPQACTTIGERRQRQRRHQMAGPAPPPPHASARINSGEYRTRTFGAAALVAGGDGPWRPLLKRLYYGFIPKPGFPDLVNLVDKTPWCGGPPGRPCRTRVSTMVFNASRALRSSRADPLPRG